MARLRRLFFDADTDGSGELNKQEYTELIARSHAQELFQALGFERQDLVGLWEVMDPNGEGVPVVAKWL